MAGARVEVCPDEGRTMCFSPPRRQTQRFGRQHSQRPIEFPCSVPQWDEKSPKPTGNPANVGQIGRASALECLSRSLRSPFAYDNSDLPLPRPVGSATLAAKPPVSADVGLVEDGRRHALTEQLHKA